MDALQRQILDLTQKVDTLHKIIERISCQINQVVSERQQQRAQSDPLATVGSMTAHSTSNQRNLNSVMEHKDILLDGSNWENDINPQSEHTLSPDIQIRRLTAQLTAAYNRIAALEEQLLARRIHS